MAKKRTLRPFYGKVDQRLEARADVITRTARTSEEFQNGQNLSASVAARVRLRAIQHVTRMASRPGGNITNVPQEVRRLIQHRG